MPIPKAPDKFEGSLEELYERHARHVLLCPHIVETFHKNLCDYLTSKDPRFLTRKVGKQERGEELRIHCGGRIKPTDNSPAWWIHYQLFNHNTTILDDFPAFIDSVPFHMFRIQLPETINSAGWHVAHIFDAKDGNTAYLDWPVEELLWRMVRNIHPCNYFYIPKTDWKKHGGQADVLTFFQEKYAGLYASIWDEFLQLAKATPYEQTTTVGDYHFSAPNRKKQTQKTLFNGVECSTSYEYSRLCFNAKWIEPLEMNQRFCIVTPNIYYIMTKREFYETFPNIVKPGSCYRNTGVYHYRSPPQRARPFMIERSKS
ncbi:hypothetical protein [Pontiella sulfatireligans]|uniref:Uncharacterized protein n=1 Tax=Pontiella sulfatireligans TaxID=2750658 RepID=A0A6C2UT11_9BACT|nr:hypothetical protein [Pontiella sulfatireligans]VGO22036.1 hypothetical protein SCARR_04117 [Pontiella sulfatireligans]